MNATLFPANISKFQKCDNYATILQRWFWRFRVLRVCTRADIQICLYEILYPLVLRSILVLKGRIELNQRHYRTKHDSAGVTEGISVIVETVTSGGFSGKKQKPLRRCNILMCSRIYWLILLFFITRWQEIIIDSN